MGSLRRKLAVLLSVPRHRHVAAVLAALYLALFLFALRDLTLGGSGFEVTTVDPARMFERTGTVTFEPVARVTMPGATLLIAPLNLLIGGILAVLVGLNLLVTYLALRQPRACSFNRSTGILASLPALLAGGACCAPTIVLILGLQLSSALVTGFQALIPVAAILLVLTLKLIVDRTEPELLVSRNPPSRSAT